MNDSEFRKEFILVEKTRLASINSKQLNITEPPKIYINKLGIVSHDYRNTESNDYRDFSYAFQETLNFLDNNEYDSILFSLYTIIQRGSYKIINYLSDLKNIKTIIVEEFIDDDGVRDVKRNVIYYRTVSG